MLELLEIRPGNRILEVGTGLGYQAALMSQLGGQVWSVEIVEEFASEARVRLTSFGYGSVVIRVGDGSRGWSDHAPFDRILVSAAAKAPPPALLEQLSVGGRMVIPLGTKDEAQQLSVVEKSGSDEILVRHVIPVRFTQLETVS